MLYFLFNQSRFGTFVNNLKVNEIELADNDIIYLVDRCEIPYEMQHQIKHLSFQLRKVINESIPGEVLIATTTVHDVIVIDSDSDDDDKYAGDYEIGEPSTKKVEAGNSEIEPMRVDPVSKVSNLLIFHLLIIEITSANID